jgi:hypothetical protein
VFLPYQGARDRSVGISRIVGSTWDFMKFSASPSVGNQISELRCLCWINTHKPRAAFLNSQRGRTLRHSLREYNRCPSRSLLPAEMAEFPSALLVGRLFRKIVVVICPFDSCLRLWPVQRTEPRARRVPQPLNLTVRYIHSATPVSFHPAQLLCSWL